MKITMYELLGMVKNGKEPKKIKYNTFELKRTMSNNLLRMYVDEEGMFFPEYYSGLTLNDTVEIIEEKPTQEEIKEYTNKFLEVWIPIKKQFGKLFDEIARIGNVLDLEDELEEEKKIPEKLKILNANDHSKEVYYENYSKEEISLDIETLQIWVNKIIDYLDYLKSKGE